MSAQDVWGVSLCALAIVTERKRLRVSDSDAKGPVVRWEKLSLSAGDARKGILCIWM